MSRHRVRGLRTNLLPLSLALVTLWALACGHHAPSDTSPDAGLLTECVQYLDLYAGCMHRLSPKTPQIADARVASARETLDRITDRAQLRRTCTAGSAQLRTSCQ